jgi:tetratricopeptide (TPR) repeat protein
MMSNLLEQIKSLCQVRRYGEACEIAHELIASDERNADAWWNLALAQHSLGELQDSITSLKTLLKLAPSFASGWAQYGVVLAANDQVEQGLKALSHALQLDPDQAFAARQAARICRERKDSDGEIHYLTRLDAMGQADGHDLNKLGIAYWEKNHFGKSIDYYHRSAAELESCAPYFNLALVYNHDEVSQDADAIDCLERALLIDPEYDKATERLEVIKSRLKKLAQNVLKSGEIGLHEEDWYQFYVNPFELLVGRNYDHDIDAYDAKHIQRLKRRLIQEIELEDGKIHYVEGLAIDKSRAIGICDELNDENLKHYHWLVFSTPNLLGFLTRGEIRHFLCLEDYKPLDLLEELDSEWSGFREWLSQTFARQYDLVLTRALQNKRVPLIESLFDGRRWILREHEERCFEGARRQVEQLLGPLRQASESAKEVKPTSNQINRTLSHDGLISIINLLPEPFRGQQSEAVSLIRSIAITAFNEHGDTDLSKEILSLARKFSFKSAALTQRLAEDFKQIEKLIAQERKHEAKLILGEDTLEVAKDGVRQGTTYIAADSVTAIRWGVMITGTQYSQVYQFLMVCRDNAGNETKFSWQSSGDIEEQQKHFSALVNAALNYIVPKIYEKIQALLDAGREVKIGPCSLSKNDLMFEKSGWFSSKRMTIPWSQVETRMSNGVLSLYDRGNPRTRVEMQIRDTENSVILQFLASIHNNR